MTLPKIDSLSIEQIRVMIAEAMGFRIQVDRKKRVNAKTEIWTPEGKLGSRKAGNDAIALTLALQDCVPDYPTDANAAETLCAWMAEFERGWTVSLNNGLDKTWECEFSGKRRTGEIAAVTADIFALAVSKAFLIANHLAE